MIRTRLTALALACALPLSSARAADAPPLRPSYDLTTDVAVTAAAVGGTLTLLLLKQELAPVSCRWCEPGWLDGELARHVGWHDPQLASNLSDVLQVAIGGGVLGYTVYDGYRRGDPEAGYANALLITEATSLALLLDTAVKYAAGRSRPYVWLGPPGPDSRDGNLSFFSGHTTFAFAVAASSSTLLLSQHAPGATALSVVAFSAAGLTGYLRMAANQHYLTDVLAGAAVGTLVGWAVPHFFHAPREGTGLALRPALGGISIAW